MAKKKKSKRIRMFVAVPSTGEYFDVLVDRLRALEKKYFHQIEFVYPDKVVWRKFHDFARNCMVDEFMESKCDIMWFVDSDVAPPMNVLDLITKHGHKWKLAGAPYPVFMTPDGETGPQVVYTVYRTLDGKNMHAASVPKDGLDYVDGMATGCIFIKREVFEKLEKPYFEFKYRQEDMHITEGEDLGFCQKVSALGYKFFTDFSMVCKHRKTICLLELNNYAIDYANKAVLAYDRAIRPQIEALEARLRSKMDSRSRAKSNIILPDDLR